MINTFVIFVGRLGFWQAAVCVIDDRRTQKRTPKIAVLLNPLGEWVVTTNFIGSAQCHKIVQSLMLMSIIKK
jgi:hypothetical protein